MKLLRDIIIEKSGLTEEHYAQFAETLKTVHLTRKEFLLQTGTTCSFLGFVEEGVLRSFIQKGASESNVDFYLSGSFVSAYTSFLTQTPTHGAIQALSDSKVRLLSRSAYDELLKRDPCWYRFGKYISDDLFIRKCRRETALLMDSASERHKLLLDSYPMIEQLVSQYHIASYLGIKPESLSRLKSLTYIKEQL
ncbi:CRP-like cAMP-binding protein [Pontibacter ummariensis]|uniref:cAMP-binding domain of CRP or a regulatory subunit of cAMP-dependent protein kinases n=1 Tax=Pontibacter ummariensis TaxID=1610492 RepID=A0A239LL04_9BACT|nr:Crp/Fnr family transcriptional regulator [Pontibacter ummariensis]PRY03146.1 CRP-like cAMP-binding protein [Pontibacter ummariensis]SNT30568.1 cAMP-binding domain of CRP or a regulatory subunit of cAMP-dependent protein kinases [Pontibacter ummariensis]